MVQMLKCTHIFTEVLMLVNGTSFGANVTFVYTSVERYEASDITFYSDIAFYSEITFYSHITFYSDLTFHSDITYDSDTTFYSDITFYSDMASIAI